MVPPTILALTDGGENDERAAMQRTVEQDRLYVMDRGYAKFALFNAIVDAKSSYACRRRDNTVMKSLKNGRLPMAIERLAF